MVTLILDGGGNEIESKKNHEFFLRKINYRRILYIPIAMSESSHTYGECFDWIRKALNFNKIDMWIDLFGRSLKEVNKYAGIYIGGGNTFKLLKIFRESGFEKLLKEYRGVIFGGSAGAIVLGKYIDTCSFGEVKDENKVGLKDTSGLNLLNDFSVKVHYREWEDPLIFDFVRKFRSKVIALKEGWGVYVRDNRVYVISKGAYVFDENKKAFYKEGDLFRLE